MIFWLVLKLEISSRVLMSILKDFGLFLEDLMGPVPVGLSHWIQLLEVLPY